MGEVSRTRDLLKEEKGFTLAEMMVSITIMITVMFALYSIFDMSIRVFSFGNDKVEAVENARLGLEKIEREVRAAYPVNRRANPSQEHVFFSPGTEATPILPGPRSITFGNELPLTTPATPPDRKIDPSLNPNEEITYRLNNGTDTCPTLPTAVTDGLCKLQRITRGGTPQDVVEFVTPDGLDFTYLHSDLTPDTSTDGVVDGTDIGVVRVRLTVDKDGRTQSLTTDIDLRNRDN